MTATVPVDGELEGGCLCGHVRYVITERPIDAGFCHCRICQRSSGAPSIAWLTVDVAGFSYAQGVVAVYRSSERSQREFCPRCGTQIAFRAIADARTVDVTLCSLDDSSRVRPEYHIWCESKADWLWIGDALPQYPDDGPDVT